MNIGRRFVSRYVLDRYCPTMPVQNNWMPPTIKIMHTKDGQPDTGSPQISVRTTITTIIKNDIRQNSTPAIEARESGATENPVIPSSEYRNN